MYLSVLKFSSSPDVCPDVGLLDHMVTLCLVFWGTSVLSFIGATPVYTPTSRVGLPLLHILSRLYYLQAFDDGHSDWCEVIPYCSFDSNSILTVHTMTTLDDGEKTVQKKTVPWMIQLSLVTCWSAHPSLAWLHDRELSS